MKAKHELPNQILLPFDPDFIRINLRHRAARTSSGARATIPIAAGRPDNGQGRCLADRRRSHVDGLREQGRAAWFMDDDAINNPDPAGPDPTSPNST